MPPKKPVPKRKPAKRPSWLIPAAVVGVVLFLAVGAMNRLHRSEQRAREAMIQAGMTPEEAAARTSDRAVMAQLPTAGDRKQRFEELKARVAAEEAKNFADVRPERARPTADPAGAFEDLLARGDLAGAQRLLAETRDDARSKVRRGRFYDAAGKDKRALEELQAAVAAGGSKITQAAAQTALGVAKLRQGDHAGAQAAAEAAIALDWTNDDAYRLAAEVARRDERWQDIPTILDKHVRQVNDADLDMRLYEAHQAMGHKGWAAEYIDAASRDAAEKDREKVRVLLAAPYDRGLAKASAAYKAAVAAGQNDLELHLWGAEAAARQKDWAGLKAAVDAAAVSGVKDARLWYWQGRLADGRNDSELADAMYAQAKARDPRFDPAALAYLRTRR